MCWGIDEVYCDDPVLLPRLLLHLCPVPVWYPTRRGVLGSSFKGGRERLALLHVGEDYSADRDHSLSYDNPFLVCCHFFYKITYRHTISMRPVQLLVPSQYQKRLAFLRLSEAKIGTFLPTSKFIRQIDVGKFFTYPYTNNLGWFLRSGLWPLKEFAQLHGAPS